MKKFTSILLLVVLLLSGCLGNRLKDPVSFYYIRTDYQETLAEVVASEEREASGHRNDLSYLLALYLMGPVSDSLISPIPAGTQITVLESTRHHVVLSLSETAQAMSDTEYALACACLSSTCLDITGAKEVTISSGSRSITITKDNMILSDSEADTATEETQ